MIYYFLFEKHPITTIFMVFAITVILSLVLVRYYNKYRRKTKHWFHSSQFLYYFSTPFLSLFAALLTFLVFTMQLQLIQRQKETSSKEQFDRYFLAYMQIHEHNLSDIKISDKISGKLSFHFMFYEFKTLLRILKKTEQSFYDKDTLSFENSVIIAFYCFRDGIVCDRRNHNTEKSIRDRFEGKYDALAESYFEEICKIKELNKSRFGEDGKVDKNKAKELCLKTEFLEEYIYSSDNFDIAGGHYSNLSTYVQTVRSTLIFFEKYNRVLQEDDYKYYLELYRNQFIPAQLYILKLYSDYFVVKEEEKKEWQKWFSEESKMNFFKYMPENIWERIELDWKKMTYY